MIEIVVVTLLLVPHFFLYKKKRKERIIQQALIEQPDHAIVIHERGAIIETNDKFCTLFGHTQKSVLDYHLLEFVCYEFRNLALGNFNKNLNEPYHVCAKTKSSERIHLEFIDIPYKSTLTVSHIRDITFQKEMEQENNDLRAQVLQNEKMVAVGSLISSVIHELNTPLTAITSYAEILATPDFNDKENIISKLSRSAHKMKEITEQLRQVSRSGRYDTLKPIDVNFAIKSAISIFTIEMERKNIQVIFNPPTYPMQIWANQNQIESVFQNLLANSRDAFDNINDDYQKTISIKTALCNNRNISINYIDNAGGMHQDIIEKLFTPFFTTKSPEKGTGLGMSITKSIVEKHNGVITATSNNKNQSIFSLTFPAIHSPVVRKDQKAKKYTIKLPYKPKVLIVDDQPEIIEILEIFLEKQFSTCATTDSFIAIEKIKNEKFDLVITDLQMPRHSGLDIISVSKTMRPNCPVIVISGHSGQSEKASIAMNKGADEIIPKPFRSREEFINQVLDVLSKNKPQAQSLTL